MQMSACLQTGRGDKSDKWKGKIGANGLGRESLPHCAKHFIIAKINIDVKAALHENFPHDERVPVLFLRPSDYFRKTVPQRCYILFIFEGNYRSKFSLNNCIT